MWAPSGVASARRVLGLAVERFRWAAEAPRAREEAEDLRRSGPGGRRCSAALAGGGAAHHAQPEGAGQRSDLHPGLGPPAALSRAPEQRRAPTTAELIGQMLVELLGLRPRSARARRRAGPGAGASARSGLSTTTSIDAAMPRCRGSRPHLRGGFDVGLDGWVIVVSRKSAAGTALRGRTHHSTPPSPLMSSGYGTPRQPRPRPIRVHTEEVTGSIPVSPTSANAPFRSWKGAFDYRFDSAAQFGS